MKITPKFGIVLANKRIEDENIQNLIKSREIDEAKAVICELIKRDFNDT